MSATDGHDDDPAAKVVVVSTAADALPRSHKLHAALEAQFRKRGPAGSERPSLPEAPFTPWSASFFGLDKVGAFRRASEEQRALVLQGAGQAVLEEAYGVEKLGMAYCAKLLLCSETTEERMAYGLIASDEAMHLHAVAPFVKRPDEAGRGPFFRLLDHAVTEMPKRSVVFLMQSVLEGWGLTHYRNLSEGSEHPALTAVLRRIVSDEAFHVGTGNVLFDPARLGDADRRAMIDFLSEMLAMVAVGPQSVVAALDRELGGLDRDAKEVAFAELECQRTAGERMGVLRDLIGACPGLAASLEERGAFVVQPPSVCAAVASS